MTKSKQTNNYRKSLIAAEGSRFKRCKFCKHKIMFLGDVAQEIKRLVQG